MRSQLTALLLALPAACAAMSGKPEASRTENGIVWVAQALPTGRTSTSAILVERPESETAKAVMKALGK